MSADVFDKTPPAVEPGRDAAWAEVIARRVREIEGRHAKLVSAADVLARARAVVTSRRR